MFRIFKKRERSLNDFQNSFNDQQKAAFKDSLMMIVQMDSSSISEGAWEIISKVRVTLGIKEGHPEVEMFISYEDSDSEFETGDVDAYYEAKKIQFITRCLNETSIRQKEFYVSTLYYLQVVLNKESGLTTKQQDLIVKILMGIGISPKAYQAIVKRIQSI